MQAPVEKQPEQNDRYESGIESLKKVKIILQFSGFLTNLNQIYMKYWVACFKITLSVQVLILTLFQTSMLLVKQKVEVVEGKIEKFSWQYLKTFDF